MAILQRTGGHFDDHRLTHRTMPVECSLTDTQHLTLGLVAIGHKTPFKPLTAARQVGQQLGHQARRTGFCRGNPELPRQ